MDEPGRLERAREKLLFAAAAAAAALVCWRAFAAPAPVRRLPADPQIKPAPPIGAVLGAEKLYASSQPEDYWEPTQRYVFVEPAPVRVFNPVRLEVPTMPFPAPPMPLPDPGPLLTRSGALPRLGASAALKPKPEPAEEP